MWGQWFAFLVSNLLLNLLNFRLQLILPPSVFLRLSCLVLFYPLQGGGEAGSTVLDIRLENINTFKSIISSDPLCKKWQCPIYNGTPEKPQRKPKSLNLQKHHSTYLIDKGLKGTAK